MREELEYNAKEIVALQREVESRRNSDREEL